VFFVPDHEHAINYTQTSYALLASNRQSNKECSPRDKNLILKAVEITFDTDGSNVVAGEPMTLAIDRT
jgi:hypothetical protein